MMTCCNCCTYRKLHQNVLSKLGIVHDNRQYIASLTNAWDLADVLLDDKNSDDVYKQKMQLWMSDAVIFGDPIRIEDMPEDCWSILERIVSNGIPFYKIPDKPEIREKSL